MEAKDAKKVVIRVDDRIRLLSAVLAATNYPDKSQAIKKHGTHLHARGTRKLVAEHSHHKAVQAMQVLLDQNIPLASMYNYALRLTWPMLHADEEMPRWVPPRWDEQLKHFYEVTGLAEWWADDEAQWQQPVQQLQEAFHKVNLYGFFAQFVGTVVETMVFMPNISYPTDQTIGFRIGSELVCIMPPPLAWGDSPPWPYKDDPALAYRAAISAYGSMLMAAYMRHHVELINNLAEKALPVDEKYAAAHPTWQDQFMGLFKASITALFLEESVSNLEAKSFMQYMQKVENLTMLPGAVSVFRRYTDEHKTGRYNSFIDYLPNLPKHLRVVRTITAL